MTPPAPPFSTNAGAALVIGGTGATGYHVCRGLAERGFDVVVLHRGTHERAELDEFRHIHADPHFAEALEPALAGEEFDTVISMYGRLALHAAIFAGRCRRFVGVGGIPVYAGLLAPDEMFPPGLPIMASEAAPLATGGSRGDTRVARYCAKLVAAERSVMEAHERGYYAATIMRYPLLYGPHNPVATEWSVVRRLLDGRRTLLLPNGGLALRTRAAAANAAHALLLALDARTAEGEAFNCGDEEQFSVAGWARLIAGALEAQIEIVSLPRELSWAAPQFLVTSGSGADHALVDTSKARTLLGYRDVVAAPAAIAETALWYAEHPLDPADGSRLGDRFDYALEDDLENRLSELIGTFETARLPAEHVHAYAHPTRPGLGADHLGR